MKKSICKECGKELSKKAEICPDCGVRVRINIKNSLITSAITIGIAILIGLTILFGLFVRDKLDKIREKKELEQLTIKEKEMFESYLGNYKLSYNEKFKENKFYNLIEISDLKENISLENKCYLNPLSRRGEGNIVDNCISFVNARTIEYVYPEKPVYIYKLDDNRTVMATFVENFIKNQNRINLLMNNILPEDEDILYQKLCFEFKSSDTLEQIKCPSNINTYRNGVIDEFPTKYEFKLTKIK